jgi:hypothetical protein
MFKYLIFALAALATFATASLIPESNMQETQEKVVYGLPMTQGEHEAMLGIQKAENIEQIVSGTMHEEFEENLEEEGAVIERVVAEVRAHLADAGDAIPAAVDYNKRAGEWEVGRTE